MDKKQFFTPEMEIVGLCVANVIATSLLEGIEEGGGEGNGE